MTIRLNRRETATVNSTVRKYRVLNIFGSLAYTSKDYGEETKVRTFLFYIYCFVIERYCLAR